MGNCRGTMVIVTGQPIVFRSTSSRVLAGIISGGALVASVAVAITDGPAGAVSVLPVLALIGGFGWAAYWRPAVVVDDTGVTVVGVIATTQVPWSSIRTIDTRWALTLKTTTGVVTAWAAPAPSRHGLYRVTKGENQNLAADTYLAGTIRPGDALSSDSGQAAEIVRRAWERWRDTPGDSPAADEPVRRRWHLATLAVGAALTALAVIALV